MLLRAALRHVPEQGWTSGRAVAMAAQELGLSPALASEASDPYTLIEQAMNDAHALSLQQSNPEGGLRVRLEHLTPLRPQWASVK